MQSMEYYLKTLKEKLQLTSSLYKPVALLKEASEAVDILKSKEAKLQTKTITPTTSQQVVDPDSEYNGFSKVTVSAVTSTIDENIVAGNIKDGVTILGVTGTYTGV